jgi:hypothetical protein
LTERSPTPKKNLANSRELFESYLNAIFTQKGDGWKQKKLGEIGGKVFTGPFGSLYINMTMFLMDSDSQSSKY